MTGKNWESEVSSHDLAFELLKRYAEEINVEPGSEAKLNSQLEEFYRRLYLGKSLYNSELKNIIYALATTCLLMNCLNEMTADEDS